MAGVHICNMKALLFTIMQLTVVRVIVSFSQKRAAAEGNLSNGGFTFQFIEGFVVVISCKGSQLRQRGGIFFFMGVKRALDCRYLPL